MSVLPPKDAGHLRPIERPRDFAGIVADSVKSLARIIEGLAAAIGTEPRRLLVRGDTGRSLVTAGSKAGSRQRQPPSLPCTAAL